MRTSIAMVNVVFCLVCGTMRAEGGSPEQKCPVVINRTELGYNHQGGQSKPYLRVEFGNTAGKQISTIVYGLSVLDPGGNPHPYPDELMYQGGLETGKKRAFTWELAREFVDIHRSGETVVVKRVEFIDTTHWIDDGSERCAFTVDFHAR